MIFFGWNGQHSAGGRLSEAILRISCCPPGFRPSTCLDCLACQGWLVFSVDPFHTMFYYHLAGIPQGVH